MPPCTAPLVRLLETELPGLVLTDYQVSLKVFARSANAIVKRVVLRCAWPGLRFNQTICRALFFSILILQPR